MKPRILLLMEPTEQGLLATFQRAESSYSFVNYDGDLTRISAREHLIKLEKRIDAVIVMGLSERDELITAAEEDFNGPRIFWYTGGNIYNPPKDKYLSEVGPRVEPSQFDDLVREHFSKL